MNLTININIFLTLLLIPVSGKTAAGKINFIRIGDVDHAMYKESPRPFTYRQFMINGRRQRYIHGYESTKPVRSLYEVIYDNPRVNLNIYGNSYTPPPSIQKKLYMLCRFDSINFLNSGSNTSKIPTCFQLLEFFTDRNISEHFVDFRNKSSRITGYDQIKDFSGIYLLDPRNGHLIHAMFHLAEGIALSKYGRDRSFFHTLESAHRHYSLKKNVTLDYVTLHQ